VAPSETTNAPSGLSFPVPPLLITNQRWCWNVDQLSIAYAFRPRLRSRLTLGRLTLPRKPQTYGEHVSHAFLATCAGIRTSVRSTRPSGQASRHTERSSTTTMLVAWPSTASVASLSPDHCRRHDIRPVSCYALFEWWLLLSQHPGCLDTVTSFPT
jgi:hypothetical protein